MTVADWTALLLPMFVAVDPIGILPAYIQMTGRMPQKQTLKFLRGSFLAAGITGLLFALFGPWVLSAMGLVPADFRVAGGLLLLVIALRSVVVGRKSEHLTEDPKASGAVPFGVPLLVGPAVLATVLLETQHYGLPLAILSLAVSLGLSWVLLYTAGMWVSKLGRTGVLVLSKLSALLLTAYAVMMLRTGIFSLMPHSV
jgi:multiple antibiotic resistance protein